MKLRGIKRFLVKKMLQNAISEKFLLCHSTYFVCDHTCVCVHTYVCLIFPCAAVAEDDGVVLVPLARHKGTYGSVMVLYVSRGVTAQPGGVDYLLPDGAALFMDGQNVSFINVSITNDDERWAAQLSAPA